MNTQINRVLDMAMGLLCFVLVAIGDALLDMNDYPQG